MIKLMATETARICLIEDKQSKPLRYDVVLTINGNDNKVSIDELKDFVRMTQNFWEVNNLYQHTDEAITEQQRWENGAKLNGLTPVGLGRPTM